ncbi:MULTISPECIES: DHA2 family efflux MFS transporter permease subunit [Rhodococcus]|uniref:MFS transporter n=1 Tax=Rhodococcoides kyotonense TaxID=398843 RepID=A0A177YBD5_9NOCA|nr:MULTISPECIES: DHA2 family efflux MFS transporter permease subunit [Rhodococcus]NIL75748.1 Multidrug resistance protein Stp [Rhodococcus sp. B10]OAK52771.1 MFS transporter [Rhodococcus kyotonensis]
MTTTSPPVPPSERTIPIWVGIVAASLPMFMATLDNLVMTSALPVIQADLSASVGELQWFMNAYTLSFATLMLVAATLGDRWGRRRVFLGGIAVFTLASIASALATTPAMLIAARAVQGAGAAAIMPLSLTLLASVVPAAKRPLAIGIWGGVSGLGVALGPVVGGAVVDGVAWEGIFWINVPVALIAVPLALVALKESLGRRQPLDYTGVLSAGASVFLLVWAVVHGNDDGWASTSVLLTFAGSAVAMIVFVARQRRASSPVVPLRLFRSRSFSLANVIGVTFTLGMFGAVFLLSQYLQIVMGYSPFQAGLRTLPWTAAPMVVAPLAGLLAPRLGLRALLVAGLTLQAGSLVWMAAILEPGTSYVSMVPALAMAGIGMGLTFAPSATAVLADMAEVDHATASSTNSTIREIGVALGIAVLTAVFLGAGGTLTPTGYTDALAPALLVGAGAVALGIVAALFMPGRTGAESVRADRGTEPTTETLPGSRANSPVAVPLP